MGALAFLAAPMMLVAFGFLIATAGCVCGWVSVSRGEPKGLALTGAVIGSVLAFLYGITLLFG